MLIPGFLMKAIKRGRIFPIDKKVSNDMEYILIF